MLTLRENCPNTELFLVRIQSKCRKVRTRNNSVFGHFSPSVNSYFLNDDIVDIKNPDRICSVIFVVDEFSGLFLHLSIYSIKHSRSA